MTAIAMCRIVGFWDQNPERSYHYLDTLTTMRDSMAHGGPDDAGNYIDNTYAIVLGHRRLSILDLSPLGHQPMISDDKRFVITYNGEIYNFQEIRGELIQHHYTFRSNTDTEVLLKAYQHWGIECLKKFRGMWAFALWDREEGRLIICRDRVGVKPLYWYFNGGVFMFSSELKAFHHHPLFKKEIDSEALSLYFSYGYIPAPHCIFKHTYKLEPASFLTINARGEIAKHTYWDLSDYYNQREAFDTFQSKSEGDIIEELRNLLTKSFSLRMISDVPVGIFLSGGIDSSLLTSILQSKSMSQIKTFTIGFENEHYDESRHARRIAHYLHTDHTEYMCTTRDALDIIPVLPTIYDEPFGDSSAIPTYLVSRLARQSVSVALSADGSDEQFFGYTRYCAINALQKIMGNPFARKILNMFINTLSVEQANRLYTTFSPLLPIISHFRTKYAKLQSVLQESDVLSHYDLTLRTFLKDEIVSMGLKNQNFNIELNKDLDINTHMMLQDMITYLPDDILVKVDRATMAHGLEAREPFLDVTILEYSASLPFKYKYRHGTSKYILKKMLATFLPQKLFLRPKQGFGIPIAQWLKDDLKHLRNDYLHHQSIFKNEYINSSEIMRLNKEFENGDLSFGSKIWLILVYQMWHEKWM